MEWATPEVARGEIYAAQRSWVFTYRSDRVPLLIRPVPPKVPPEVKPKPAPKPAPPLPRVPPTVIPRVIPIRVPIMPPTVPPKVPAVPKFTLRDLLPAPPPYPPLPRFLVERLLGREITGFAFAGR